MEKQVINYPWEEKDKNYGKMSPWEAYGDWEDWMMGKIGLDKFVEIDVYTKADLYGIMCDLCKNVEKGD